LMILYEGTYSGRLVPWRHYVPLKKDHSNMAEVVEVLRDEGRAQAIVDTAFSEVALNPDNSFAAMVRQVDSAIDRVFCEEMAARKLPYDEAPFAAILRRRRRREQVRKAYVSARRLVKIALVEAIRCVAACLPQGSRQWLWKRILNVWPGMLDV
jgi:hypothetical protein